MDVSTHLTSPRATEEAVEYTTHFTPRKTGTGVDGTYLKTPRARHFVRAPENRRRGARPGVCSRCSAEREESEGSQNENAAGVLFD